LAARLLRKNDCKSSRASSAQTPSDHSTWWFRPGSVSTLPRETHAPNFGSRTPQTTLATRAWLSAPAHMKHGSTVVYTVAPTSRMLPVARAACEMATSSA